MNQEVNHSINDPFLATFHAVDYKKNTFKLNLQSTQKCFGNKFEYKNPLFSKFDYPHKKKKLVIKMQEWNKQKS
jgi:hypothetical protein